MGNAYSSLIFITLKHTNRFDLLSAGHFITLNITERAGTYMYVLDYIILCITQKVTSLAIIEHTDPFCFQFNFLKKQQILHWNNGYAKLE